MSEREREREKKVTARSHCVPRERKRETEGVHGEEEFGVELC